MVWFSIFYSWFQGWIVGYVSFACQHTRGCLFVMQAESLLGSVPLFAYLHAFARARRPGWPPSPSRRPLSVFAKTCRRLPSRGCARRRAPARRRALRIGPRPAEGSGCVFPVSARFARSPPLGALRARSASESGSDDATSSSTSRAVRIVAKPTRRAADSRFGGQGERMHLRFLFTFLPPISLSPIVYSSLLVYSTAS